jgi:hypothetical protein
MSDAITKPEKSWVRQWIDQAKGSIQGAAPTSPVSYVRETGSTLSEYAEGGAVGALLGTAHAKWGLDTRGGPIDGWLAGLGFLTSIGLSGHHPVIAAHARKVGGQAFTVLAFRKGYEVVKHQALPGGTASTVQHVAAPAGKGPGIAGEDPIEKAARGIG